MTQSDTERLPTRADLRRAALLATHHWMVASIGDTEGLAIAAGHTPGSDILVVMRATTNNHDMPTDEDPELREALQAVEIASPAGITTITSENHADWADIVALWHETREVFAISAIYAVDPTLVLDLDSKVIASYEPTHCPKIGIEAEMMLSAQRPPDGTGDPFEELLAGVAEPTDWESRINLLLERYGLDPLSQPHDGECTLLEDEA